MSHYCVLILVRYFYSNFFIIPLFISHTHADSHTCTYSQIEHKFTKHLICSLAPFSNLPVLSSNRLEPPSLSDGGDVSPVGLVGGLPGGEPVSPTDTPTEDNLEKDR